MIRIMINKTVPNNPVIAEMGISDAVNVLEMMSVSTMNIEPNPMLNGIVLFVFLPTASLAMWGTTRPIHPIVPEKATELAVNKVAIPIIKNRYLL